MNRYVLDENSPYAYLPKGRILCDDVVIAEGVLSRDGANELIRRANAYDELRDRVTVMTDVIKIAVKVLERSPHKLQPGADYESIKCAVMGLARE